MQITVHSKTTCVQCRATERHVDSKGIEVNHVNLEENLDTLKALTDRGLAQAPVVLVFDENGAEIDHWTGYRPDKLDEYAAKQQESRLALAGV